MRANTLKFGLRLEVLLPILFLLLHLFYYQVVAQFAATEGRNFSHFIVTPLDHWIPVLPIFVIPYTLIALLNPLVAVYYLIKVRGFDRGFFRRLYVSLAVMTSIAYIIWVVFPVKDMSSLQTDHYLQASFLGHIVLDVHHSISLWNSFPSYHVMLPWFLYRVMQYYARDYAWILAWMAVLIAVATLTIKVHYIADVASAILIAEFAFRTCLKPLEQQKVFENVPERVFLGIYITLLTVLVLGASMIFFGI